MKLLHVAFDTIFECITPVVVVVVVVSRAFAYFAVWVIMLMMTV